MKKLIKILSVLLILLPSTLFFSYQPIIKLGETDAMHLELSIPLLWLAATALCTLPLLPQIFRHTPKKLLLASLLIPCYTIISLLWSSNPLRTFLSAGVLACIALSLLALPLTLRSTPDFKQKTLRYFLLAATLVCIFAWLQSILDITGVSRDVTLLCEGCTYQSFGFPHPNAFAIEPQFFGNLLLAPVFLTYYSLLYNKKQKSQDNLTKTKKSASTPAKSSPRLFARLRRLSPVLLAVFFTTTLFFTFSRGAIYAFLAATSVLILYHFCKKHFQILKLIPIILCSAIISLFCQGIMAQLSPTSDTFLTGVTKSIHQMTLGKIDLRPQTEEPSPSSSAGASLAPVVTGLGRFCSVVTSANPLNEENEGSSLSAQSQLANMPISGSSRQRERTIGSTPATAGWATGARDGIAQADSALEASRFDGYVEQSTDERVSLTNMALDLWNDTPRNIILGTGLGGSGPVLYEKYAELGTAQQIVQNEYVSLLLEFGLVGLALVLTTIIIILRVVRENLVAFSTARSFLVVLVLAYALTLLFFSGLPNALHIYLLPTYAYLFTIPRPPHKTTKSTKNHK